ncbi:MAG: S41 family peptidase [Bacteroidota bacterium]
MNKQKIQVWLPLLLSISMIGGIFIGFKMRDNIPGKNFFSIEKSTPVEEVMELIQKKYVDQVNMRNLADTAIDAMLNKLDPHSLYIPPSRLEDINDEIQGNFYGIGIEFEIYKDTLNVIHVTKDGPGEKSGLLAGDKLIRVNEILVAGKKIGADSIRSLLRGSRGTKINIEIFRNTALIKIPLTRDLVPVNSIDAAYMMNKETGFIKLNKFSTQTYREFMIALTDLKKQGLKNLIFDLRGNGGGVLDDAIDIADEFLEGDKLITYTEGVHFPKKEYRCRRLGQFEKGKLIVLADEESASASEVLMGALQDWDRATIIGRRSFGKGLVQEQYDLSDHGALRLTIARYYTPTGRSIQRSYANGEKAYYAEIEERIMNSSNVNNDSAANNGKLFLSPSGKKLYSGGGIMPDYLMNTDSSDFSNDLLSLYAKGTINHFAFQYTYLNKDLKLKYPTPALFTTTFNISDANWNQLTNEMQADSIDIKRISAKDKQNIITDLKALIARLVWEKNGYFQVINANDKTIKKALEIIN